MVLTASPKEHGTNRFSNDKLYLIVRALLPNTAIYNDSKQDQCPVPTAQPVMGCLQPVCTVATITASIRVSRSGDYCAAVRISRKLPTWYGQGFLVRW